MDYTRIERAAVKTHKVALKLFYQPSITAACSAFLEMLGVESITLRLLIQAGNTILTHKLAGLSMDVKRTEEAVMHSQLGIKL